MERRREGKERACTHPMYDGGGGGDKSNSGVCTLGS